jgi:hypothetical protein
MPRSAFPTGVQKSVTTLIIAKPLLDCLRAIKKRTGIPANAIAALAIDEYLQRAYTSDLERAIAGQGIVAASEYAQHNAPHYEQPEASHGSEHD